MLGGRIGERVRSVAPSLLAVPGCGDLTAAKLVGETADITRFKSEAAYARYAGVAPVPDGQEAPRAECPHGEIG